MGENHEIKKAMERRPINETIEGKHNVYNNVSVSTGADKPTPKKKN